MTFSEERVGEMLEKVNREAFAAGLTLGTRLGYVNLIGFLATIAYLTSNL